MMSYESISRSSGMSIDEKCTTLENMILSSPPGEVKEVYNDLKVLVKNEKNMSKHMSDAFMKYNFTNFVVGSIPSIETPFIISKYSMINDGRIMDPRSMKVFNFDHYTMTASSITDYVHNPKFEPLRVEFEKKFDAYLKEKFPTGVLSVYSIDNCIKILISSSKFTPNKFINGTWRSEWTFNPKSFSIEGELNVKIHYFDSGNVQLRVSDKISTRVPISKRSPGLLVSEIASIISLKEDQFHRNSKTKFDKVNDSIFKNLRKVLPITKTTMNWDLAEGYNMIKILNGI